MSVIESIRTFIKNECPLLKEFSEMFPVIGIDKLEENVGSYAVVLAPGEPIVKRYVNGDTIRRVSFYFSSREAYEFTDNIDTSEFYERFMDWMEKCTRTGKLPKLKPLEDENRIAKSMKATTHSYLMDATETKAQYQIQCEFQYYQCKGEI